MCIFLLSDFKSSEILNCFNIFPKQLVIYNPYGIYQEAQYIICMICLMKIFYEYYRMIALCYVLHVCKFGCCDLNVYFFMRYWIGWHLFGISVIYVINCTFKTWTIKLSNKKQGHVHFFYKSFHKYLERKNL